MSPAPLLSVIIPALNEEKYIPRLLSDLSKQRVKNFEVIVVDGNSDDATQEVSLKYSKDLNLIVLNAKKRNVSFQRNLGAKSAHGEYLVFIDADSRVKSTFSLNLQQNIHKYHYLLYLPTIVPDKGNQAEKMWFNIANFITDLSQYLGRPIPSVGSMVFQKDFFDFLGGYNEKGWEDKTIFGEDHEIVMRARKYGVIGKCMKNVRVGFSLRRTQKEGRLSILRKYVTSTIYISFKGSLDRKLFDYEMGGQAFDKKALERNIVNNSKNTQLKNLAKQFAASLKEIIKE